MKNLVREKIKKVIKQRYGTFVTANITSLAANQLLEGRTALITGGTTGIGKAIAEAYLNAGADVIITSRTEEKAKIIEGELKKKYPSRSVLGIEMDMMDIQSFKNKVELILQTFNRVDILVNNAGIGVGQWGNTSVEEWDNVIKTNLRGPFFLTEIVARYMRDNKIKGNILNICSSASLRPANTAYRLSKWSMRAFTLGIAKTLIPYDIVVNGIAPGPTATALMGVSSNDRLEMPFNPNMRMATPEEIANMAVIYVSNMSRTIVGDIAYMTGGAGVLTVDDNDKYQLL